MSRSAHFNDWPNSIGFDSDHEELEPTSLRITGTIPAYAVGTLYRTGPGKRSVTRNDANHTVFRASHWFDGFSQVHRFQLIATDDGAKKIDKVLYNSRYTCDDVIRSVASSGKLDGVTFAQGRDPCESFFHKVSSFFTGGLWQYFGGSSSGKSWPSDRNAGVTLSWDMPGLLSAATAATNDRSSSTTTLYNKTDASFYQQLDPRTLEPVGIAYQSDLHPELVGPLSASHARSDPVTGDVYNYNLELGLRAKYRVFHVAASTGKTRILATIQGPHVQAAYIHSFFLTEHYVVLCVWGSHLAAGGSKILWTMNILEAMSEWDSARRAQWYVVSRHGGLVAEYHSDPFFSFHTINAWEDEDDIICELASYENADVLKRYYLDNLMSLGPNTREFLTKKDDTIRPRLERWRLRRVTTRSEGDGDKEDTESKPRQASREWSTSPKNGLELPTFNHAYIGKPSRFIYGFTDHGESSQADGIGKYDTATHRAWRWTVHGHSPGEPIFVADPRGAEEDDGVLLSVVLDGHAGTSYLLALDARDLRVVGKVECDWPIGLGFHGMHVGEAGTTRAVDI